MPERTPCLLRTEPGFICDPAKCLLHESARLAWKIAKEITRQLAIRYGTQPPNEQQILEMMTEKDPIDKRLTLSDTISTYKEMGIDLSRCSFFNEDLLPLGMG